MRFSVMVPTHEPGDLLRTTLVSVLRQALPPAEMQIAVVDDHSIMADVRGIISSLPDGHRIEFRPSCRRLGLAGNWNRAIELARGQLVHILHQDDCVHDGFYERIDHAFRKRPSIGMAFCRSEIVDAAGHRIKTCSRQAWRQGILTKWLPRIAERQRVQTPAAVVARGVYEKIGGYRADLRQAVDWEMWVRIAASYEVWYEPRVLAAFRRHGGSESTRLSAQGAVWRDMLRAIMINACSLPDSIREDVVNRSARWHAASALRTARAQFAAGDAELARESVDGARHFMSLCTNPRMATRFDRRFGKLREPAPAASLRAA